MNNLVSEPGTGTDLTRLVDRIRARARVLGFQQCGIADTDLSDHEIHLLDWLDRGFHGGMDYMSRHGTRRSRPDELVPGTIRVISLRMDYLPPDGQDPELILNQPELGYVSRYALGRDYHRLIRRRVQQLADFITDEVGDFGYRAFVDSAPVLEKALAEKSGLGWIGKHSNLLDNSAGSWFFLGELYTDLPLPIDAPALNHCGSCSRCITACPTDAIVAPYQVDARRCISYLTIEHFGPIPEPFREPMGNRIYGCDDCQLVCPFNKFATPTTEQDFSPRHQLDAPQLADLFLWREDQFLERLAGSPIRRIGHERWLRNIAVALGNAPGSNRVVSALEQREHDSSELVREHVGWALARHRDQS
jgi:epoxyqueuosine reductase